jgi:Tol biopolymer transport system component
MDFRTWFPIVLPGFGEQADHLIFYSNRSGRHQLYQVNLDGSDLVPLTQIPDLNYYNMGPAFNSDGRIAFTSDHVNNSWEVFILEPDNRRPTQITEWGANSWALTWAPDGNALAFASGVAGDDEIFLVTLDGSEPVNLTQRPDASDFFPAWSPDGEQIAFVSDREGDQDIYVMNKDGSDVARLTAAEGRDSAPSWSPDGTKIAFVTERDGNFEVYVMNADGSDPLRLTDNSVYEWSPTWSPDGTLIAFTSTREHYETYDVYIMAPDGSNQTRLTFDPADDIIPRWWP